MKFPSLTLAVMTACLLVAPAISHADAASPGKTMKQCMKMTRTGDADADFVTNMIPHHQMAIDMAKKELAKGGNPEARAMAQKMIDAQQEEITTMQAWLKNHQEMNNGQR